MPVVEGSPCTDWDMKTLARQASVLCWTSQLDVYASGFLGCWCPENIYQFLPWSALYQDRQFPILRDKISKVPWKHNTGWDSSICISRDFAIRQRSGALLLSQMCWEEGRSYLPFPEFQPLLGFPSRCLSCLFWGCTEGHCVPHEVLGAGPQGGGKEGRMALEGAVTKPGAMMSDWWAPQDGRRQRCFPLNVQLLPAHRTGLACWWRAHSSLSLPDSVITPISSLWRRVCRITMTTTGMMPSSDFSNVLAETELFPLTGSQKSPAGKKWASWNSDWGFCTVHSHVMCWESHNHVLKRER